MEHKVAVAVAKVIALLHRFGIVDDRFADKIIDRLTVRVLESDLKRSKDG